MAIHCSCTSCNRSLTLKDDLAGKKIRCPGCKEVIKVPSGKSPTSSSQTRPNTSSGSTRLEQTATPPKADLKCPNCKKPLTPTDTICPHCRYNLTASKQVSSRRLQSAMASVQQRSSKVAGQRSAQHAQRRRKERNAKNLIRFGLPGCLILVIVTVVIAAYISQFSVPAFEDLIAEHPPKPFIGALGQLHPYQLGQEARARIPFSQIYLYDPVAPAPSSGDLSTSFAEQNALPYLALEPRLGYKEGVSVMYAIQDQTGRFTPDGLSSFNAALPLIVWRLQGDLNQENSLTGMVLDFDAASGSGTDVLAALRDYHMKREKRDRLIEDRLIQGEREGRYEGGYFDTTSGKRIDDDEARAKMLELSQQTPQLGSAANSNPSPGQPYPETNSGNSRATQMVNIRYISSGEMRERYRQTLETRYPPISEPTLLVTAGTVGFLYSQRFELQGGPGSYAQAIQINQSFINPLRSEAPAETLDDEGYNWVYFHPILNIKNARIKQPTN